MVHAKVFMQLLAELSDSSAMSTKTKEGYRMAFPDINVERECGTCTSKVFMQFSAGKLGIMFVKCLVHFSHSMNTVMIQRFRTDRSGQTVKTQIRLLLEEQSDQGLHCFLFHLHLFDKIP